MGRKANRSWTELTLDDYKCPCCYKYKTRPYLTCRNQHVICPKCKERLTRCPICRVPYTVRPIYSQFLKKNSHRFRIACKNASRGCTQQTPLDRYAKHKACCVHALVKCPVVNCRPVILGDLTAHCIAEHRSHAILNVRDRRIRFDPMPANVRESYILQNNNFFMFIEIGIRYPYMDIQWTRFGDKHKWRNNAIKVFTNGTRTFVLLPKIAADRRTSISEQLVLGNETPAALTIQIVMNSVFARARLQTAANPYLNFRQ